MRTALQRHQRTRTLLRQADDAVRKLWAFHVLPATTPQERRRETMARKRLAQSARSLTDLYR